MQRQQQYCGKSKIPTAKQKLKITTIAATSTRNIRKTEIRSLERSTDIFLRYIRLARIFVDQNRYFYVYNLNCYMKLYNIFCLLKFTRKAYDLIYIRVM